MSLTDSTTSAHLLGEFHIHSSRFLNGLQAATERHSNRYQAKRTGSEPSTTRLINHDRLLDERFGDDAITQIFT